MNSHINKLWPLLFVLVLTFSSLACNLTATPEPDQPTPTLNENDVDPTSTAMPAPTPTPTTPAPASDPPTPEPPSNECEGLSGEIQVQVLVGPSEAVGLEPFAIGGIPFAVVSGEAPYLVEGGGPISYADILVQEWGTFEVTMDLEIAISGECVPGVDGTGLDLVLQMDGEQVFIVTAEGFSSEYPWSGSYTFDLNYPLVDGSTVEGEGRAFILHLDGR